MEALSARIFSQASYKKGEKPNLIFELSNHSKTALHVLKWNTPLEGLKSDCLVVKKNKKTIEYDGRLVKRGTPRPEDYIVLAPGSSVSSKVDASDAYDLSTPGKTKVDFRKELMVYTNQPVTAALIRGGAVPPPPPKSELAVSTNHAEFNVVGGDDSKLTDGEKMRRAEAQIKLPSFIRGLISANRGAAVPELLPCDVRSATAAQEAIVRKAHANGYALTKSTLEAMAQNEFYKTWFGKFTPAHFKRVKIHFQDIQHDFENKHFIYDLSCTGCDATDYAYTYKNARTIWLCNAFWDAPDLGANSKAGTMVHEHSHVSASTVDNEYSEADCRALAKKSPGRAIRNADSHEFYAKG